jgi:hypothetical protein
MIIVAIVGTLFAALAVCGVWVRTHDPDDLREMGVVLGYKDEHAVIDTVVDVPQQHALKRRTRNRTIQSHKGPLRTDTRAGARAYARQP